MANDRPAMQRERGLPCAVDVERWVLGSILLDGNRYIEVAATVSGDSFSLDTHKKIWRAMCRVADSGSAIDRITVVKELHSRTGELDSVGGLSYLIELDTGLPDNPAIEEYCRILVEKQTLRNLLFACQHTMDRVYAGQDQAADILAGAGETLLKLGEEQVKAGLMTPAQVLENFEGGISAFLDPTRRMKGVPTGFLKLDEYTGGLHPGELFILAARPSVGKSAMALNIAQHVSLKLRKKVALFSLEMSRESLLVRLLCSVARIDGQRFRQGYLSAHERREQNVALDAICSSPLWIDDSAGLHLMEMHAKLRRLQAEGEIGLVIVDYLQLMGSRGRTENRNQEVSALSRGLKLMAKDLNVPVMALSQLSRASETRSGDHRPQLSDLRESGSLEQDADVVGFIFREEMYHRDREDLRGLAELILAKQRSGPTGIIKLVFLHSQTRFDNRAEDTGEGGDDERTRDLYGHD